MKYKLHTLNIVGVISALFLAILTSPANSQPPTTTASSEPGYRVENLSAEIYSEGAVLLVKGEIRNMRPSPLRGYAIIHLQNENREEVSAFETEVNKNAPFLPGTTGQLELAVNISQFPKAKNISLEFVSR